MFIIMLQYICTKFQIIFHWVKGNKNYKIGSTRGPSTVITTVRLRNVGGKREREREGGHISICI